MNSSSSSSSRPPQQHGENEDISWLDFLRTAGGTVSADRSASADRKRRHAGSSPERRAIPHHPAFTQRRPSATDAAGPAGTSRETAIDLTSPPRQRPQMPQRVSGSNENMRASVRPVMRPTMGSMRGSFAERRDSGDIVLPKWQPDGDVSRCPVCQTEFSFWYRKHHCRKCGRVVCAACSPHRITIPRQYIVQPPNSSDGERSPTSPTRSPYPRNLGGGDVVRVCNPCVPDPWTPDTAPDGNGRTMPEERGGRNTTDTSQRPDRYRAVPPLPPPPFDQTRTRMQPNQSGPTFSRSLPQGQTPSYIFRDPYNRPPPPPPPHPAPPTHSHPHPRQPSQQPYRHPQSSWPAPMHPPPPPNTRPPIPSTPSAPPQPRPRREIREEDECPVCGTELPQGDALRESHIQECIAARFASTPSASAPVAPPRSSSVGALGGGTGASNSTPQSQGQTQAQAQAQAPLPTTATTPADSRPRATSYRPRGMAIYKATEKDCTTEDGEPQECVICFEEFQPGDEMGRMECLCKFHRGCIRAWWDTKGVGSCPTHMLQE